MLASLFGAESVGFRLVIITDAGCAAMCRLGQ